jgi:hypothetical protein
MKARLMYPDWDFEPRRAVSREERDVVQDLALDTLLHGMAGDDTYLSGIARTALLSGVANDARTIKYRQAIMEDCLNHAAVVRELYRIAVDAIERRRQGGYYGFLSRSPGSILSGGVGLLGMLVDMLRQVRAVADQHASQFRSAGMTTLFATLQQELSDDYLASVQDHLVALKFKQGVHVSATLGPRNEGATYVLRQPGDKRPTWFQRILGKTPQAFEFRIHERDEAGMRALSELRDRGINEVANAAAQSADHILSFFVVLSAELAFYVCGLNLRDKLAGMDAPICMPTTAPMGARALECNGLYDVCLALSLNHNPVGNAVNADGKGLMIITGANQGGKSSFLRAVGLAQLMMQCGMFVGAYAFTGELCTGLFTHYKREEDATMQRGKFDEELARLSDIVGAITPGATLLCNESFAATNEHEGSEIARQVVTALLEQHVRILFVTHLYEFAHGMFEQAREDILFLRAERQPDGARTFRLVTGEPLATSYGQDLYKEVFAASSGPR